MVIQLKSKNIALLPVREAHADIIYQKVYSNPGFLKLFRLANGKVSKQQISQNIRQRNQTPFNQQAYQEFLVRHKNYGVMGIVALAGLSLEHRRAELLLGVFEANHRKSSYALEATLLIMHYAYNTLQLNRLDSLIYDYNLRAKQSTESLGFLYEGLRKEYIYSLEKDAFIDLSCYALLRSEFKKNKRLSRLSKRLIGTDITSAEQTGFAPTLARTRKMNNLVRPTIPT